MRFPVPKLVATIVACSMASLILMTLVLASTDGRLCPYDGSALTVSILREHGFTLEPQNEKCMKVGYALAWVCIVWISAITSIISGMIYLIWCIVTMSNSAISLRETVSGVIDSPMEQRELEGAQTV